MSPFKDGLRIIATFTAYLAESARSRVAPELRLTRSEELGEVKDDRCGSPLSLDVRQAPLREARRRDGICGRSRR